MTERPPLAIIVLRWRPGSANVKLQWFRKAPGTRIERVAFSAFIYRLGILTGDIGENVLANRAYCECPLDQYRSGYPLARKQTDRSQRDHHAYKFRL